MLVAACNSPALGNDPIRRSGATVEIGEMWFGYPEPQAARTHFRSLSRAAFGNTWPLAADEALVGCALEMPGRTVMLVVAGQPWSLNGQTSSWAAENLPRLSIDGEKRWVQHGPIPASWVKPHSEIPGEFMSLLPLLEAASRMGCLAGRQKQGF